MTNGYLQTPGDPQVTWPGAAPLGVPFQVRQPLMKWGFGSQLIEDKAGAIGSIVAGLFFDGVSCWCSSSGTDSGAAGGGTGRRRPGAGWPTAGAWG